MTIDPYGPLDALPREYVDRLRELRVLDDIQGDWTSSRFVVNAIINAVTDRGYHDKTTPVALRQKAANVAARASEVLWWHDRGAVSNALAKAADALPVQP